MSNGIKRDRDGNARPGKAASSGPPGRFQDMFSTFRAELDEHHDRRERLIKASRDVTAQSKKIIFTLQRARDLNQEFPPAIQTDVDTRLKEITRLLESIGPDLKGINRHRYQSQLSGLEELVEALSFAYYLRHQVLITPTQAQAEMPMEVSLSPRDYMYGIFDLTGEMMRFATVTTAQKGELLGSENESGEGVKRNILGDMQTLGCEFEMLPGGGKGWWDKMRVMRQSIAKVEMLGYGLVVRGSERPKGWVPDMKEEPREVEVA